MLTVPDIVLSINVGLLTLELILAIVIANLSRRFRLSPGDIPKQRHLQSIILPLLVTMVFVAFMAATVNVLLS